MTTETQEQRTRVGHTINDECDHYVGRGPNQESLKDYWLNELDIGDRGWLGNPYSLEDGYGRDEAIREFREAFQKTLSTDEQFRKAIRDLAGDKLGCWCQCLDEDAPACHAEVIAEHADLLAEESAQRA